MLYVPEQQVDENGLIQHKHGVVRGPCNAACDNQTTIKSVSGLNAVIAAMVTWTYIDVSEPFLILTTVNSMAEDDLDMILLLAEVDFHLNISVLLPNNIPVLQWVTPNTTDSYDSDQISIDNCGSSTSSTFMSLSREKGDAVDICRTESPTEVHYQIDNTRQLFHPIGNALVDIISSLTRHLMWPSTFVLTDNDEHLGNLVRGLSESGVSVVTGMMPDIQSPRFEQELLSKIDFAIRELPNITIVCSIECVWTILKKPFSIARWEVHRYAMRHMTRWLIVTFGDRMAADQLTNLETNLDNVVVIVLPDSVVRNSLFNGKEVQTYIQAVLSDIGSSYNVSYGDENNTTFKSMTMERILTYNKMVCHWVSIEALMWTQTGRKFQTVGHIRDSGRLLTSGDIFPNTKFGFNGRKLLVSTNTWYPFVSKHNETFSGFCIDMLDHLAISLNFTYRLTMPADGAWGMEFENGSFNGLVGQMQRNEVDLTVAPMSIQTNREAVMDFSYPYYFEPTIMLLKKPDPSETKWRTLIDPFTTTVLICIGISLPTMSFVMCMLEYLSPYYRGIPDRASMRGLHHFSDSFWYLYGALLTQGGEHMSDAVSGRTLLSFWWLFCIAMMATYSGNLIAFLTVSKERLPFDTISGMIKQDIYKWGTIGGTAFIDIFRASEQHEFQQVWNGIVSYNQSDRNVLSPDPEVHISKVLSGNYVFLADKTYSELRMRGRKECDLVMTKEEFLPFQYAVGLPNNSPYTKLFADAVLTIHESGLLEIWKLKNWPKRSTCFSSMVPEATIVTLIDIQSAFYLIGIGIVIGGTVLLCECGYSYWERHKGINANRPAVIHKHTKRIT
ncbi:glutamate receptor ionotropic, kainate 1-like [Ylistrum balloti]|uniref:glutamate receptor ionotropic, kainate 1-like n=1 Tax=Ylistrum balloti TaxID=509963 RepID=UPI002905BC14|nr:glutamate receptor ionotropic, kainate 1-like [Ylistrum balloti]